jgi:ABC-type methionine transport system permease subunit
MIFTDDDDTRADFSTPWPDVPGLLFPAYGQTWIMVSIAMLVVVIVGIPLGVILHNTSPSGLFPRPKLHAVLSTIVNIGRSLPFLVLMTAIIPFTKLIVGTTIGVSAAIVPMAVAGIPYFGRLVQNAIREVRSDVIDVGVTSGGSAVGVIRAVQISEALPSIVSSITLMLIGAIEYSAIAGAIGAGGVGYLAVSFGYNRYDDNIMLACVVILILTIQLIQFVGDRVVRLVTR